LEGLDFGTGQGYSSQPVDNSGYQQYGTSPGYGSSQGRNDYGKTPAGKDRFVVLVSEAPYRPDLVNPLFHVTDPSSQHSPFFLLLLELDKIYSYGKSNSHERNHQGYDEPQYGTSFLTANQKVICNGVSLRHHY